MTEQERESFLTRNATRAPGKRAIKPTKYLFSELPDGEDEEDDKDFLVSNDERSDDEGENSSSEDDEDEDSDEDSGDTTPSGNIDDEATMDVDDEKPDSKKDDIKRCSICLGLESPEQLISVCDRCHVVVHESCYGVNEEDTESIASGGYVPWFCEPCLFGLQEPPYCEFCPSRYGAFKRTDVGGNWIHVLCSHYIPKITYADVEKLTAVSYQEFDHRQFGRKPCHACNDPIKSRVGVAVPCEAGLCKNNYHVTCAQRLGMLVELEKGEVHEGVGHLLCKRHTLSDDLKRRRKMYDKFLINEEKRMIMLRRRILGEKEESHREQQRVDYEHRLGPLDNIITPGPANAKRVRMIQTSSEIIEGFVNKAEMALGIDRDRYIKEMSSIPNENLALGGILSFSEESVRYFEYRENVLFDEQQEYLEELKVNKEEALQKEEEAKAEITRLEDIHYEILENSRTASDLCTAFVDLLAPLGAKGISKAFLRLPKKHPPKPAPKVVPSSSRAKIGRPAGSEPPKLHARTPEAGSPEVITLSDDEPPTLIAQVTQPKPQKPKIMHGNASSSKNASMISNTSSTSASSTVAERKKRQPLVPDVPKICFTCKQDNDPQLMPFCDSCKHFYHLSCLDPPLTKMPKVTRYYGWTCSDCYEAQFGEDDDEKSVEEKLPSPEVSGRSSADENLATSRRTRRTSNVASVTMPKKSPNAEVLSSVPNRKRPSDAAMPMLKKRGRAATTSPEKNTSTILEMCLQAEKDLDSESPPPPQLINQSI